jgi:hypothetical protein
MDARETAERHGGFVLAGDFRSVGADFAPGAMDEFMKHGKAPPRPTTKFELVGESQDGDTYIYEIKYSNDAGESQTVRSTWGKVGDEWKIVSAEPA